MLSYWGTGGFEYGYNAILYKHTPIAEHIMKTIFISYSRTDAEPASHIAEKLQERYDVDVFIDYLRLRAGDRFSKRLGKEIETLVNEKLMPGTYHVRWNGSHLPSGIYFYRLEAGTFKKTKKLILQK